jgi:hypothetical protein
LVTRRVPSKGFKVYPTSILLSQVQRSARTLEPKEPAIRLSTRGGGNGHPAHAQSSRLLGAVDNCSRGTRQRGAAVVIMDRNPLPQPCCVDTLGVTGSLPASARTRVDKTPVAPVISTRSGHYLLPITP